MPKLSMTSCFLIIQFKIFQLLFNPSDDPEKAAIDFGTEIPRFVTCICLMFLMSSFQEILVCNSHEIPSPNSSFYSPSSRNTPGPLDPGSMLKVNGSPAESDAGNPLVSVRLLSNPSLSSGWFFARFKKNLRDIQAIGYQEKTQYCLTKN